MMLYIIPYLFYSLLSLLGVFFQAEFFSFIPIFGVKPDLLLIVAILAGLHTGKNNGAVAGAVIGFWADLLIAGYFGIHILIYALIGYLSGSIQNRRMFKSYLGYFFIILAGGFLSGLMFIIGYSIVGAEYTFWRSFTAIVIPYTFYKSLLVILSFPFIFVYRRFRGLKIGYVDMFGGGIVLITNNRRVDMSLVDERKAHKKRSHPKKRHKGSYRTRGTQPTKDKKREKTSKNRVNGSGVNDPPNRGNSPYYDEGYYGFSHRTQETLHDYNNKEYGNQVQHSKSKRSNTGKINTKKSKGARRKNNGSR